MATIIFVHGTGGRNHKYLETYKEIEKKLQVHQQIQKFKLKLSGCLWGDEYGANLIKSGGKSIPRYDFVKSISSKEEKEREVSWQKLRTDPMWEILLLSCNKSPTRWRPGRQYHPGDIFHKTVEKVAVLAPEVTALLQEFSQETIQAFQQAYSQAYSIVTTHSHYKELKKVIPEGTLLKDYYEAVVRAIISQAWILLESEYVYNPISDEEFCEKIINLLAKELTGEFEAKSWFKLVKNIYMLPGQLILKHRDRTALMDAFYPAAGDIVLYQARGEAIRQFIKDKIQQATPPVILLAHSLGGIACVDLLIDPRSQSEFKNKAELGKDDLEIIKKVKLLITVGSQAPFLYEINALQSLPYSQPLPQHFPRRWLNIYNPYDILSYLAADVFPVAEAETPLQITDEELVETTLFPDSHTEYWKKEKMWDTVAKELQAMQEQGELE